MKEFKLKDSDIKTVTTKHGGCIASDKITVEGCKIGYMYREAPSNSNDSGWRFFEGTETEEFTSNPNNFDIFDLNTICNYDRAIIDYLDSPIGNAYVRKNDIFITESIK